MRISTAWAYQRSTSNMLKQQGELSHTRRQLATGKRILTPSDDPVGATRALGLDKAISRTDQFQRNIDAATSRLDHEENTLASVVNVLQSVRQHAIQANNDSQTNSTRNDIALQVRQGLDQLLQLANTRDGHGDYIFAGYSTHAQPFTRAAGGADYQGDHGQRLFQIGPSQQVAGGDNGAAVFERIANGNGTFAVTPEAANSGSGVVGASAVTDPAVYDDGAYSVTFTAPDAYEVRDSANNVVTTGSYTRGQAIEFQGIQFTLDGAPAAGDTFQIAPSTDQSVFKTLDGLADALAQPASGAGGQARLHNAVNAAVKNIDQALDHTLTIRSRIGARLNTLEDRQSQSVDQGVRLKAQLSQTRDLNYADAASRLSLQSTVLQAAQQAFTKVQGLSLFKFLR